MRGHEEASGTKYVPSHLFNLWSTKDPIANFENYLIAENIISSQEVLNIKEEFRIKINIEVEKGYNQPEPDVNPEQEIADMYSPFVTDSTPSQSEEILEARYIDAISLSLKHNMQKHENLVIMGQDIAEYGGAFKITQGFVEEFGKERVKNTPICESAVVGAALGLSINGFKAIVEMQFADFVTCGFNQIVNNLAKTHYRWGEKVDVVVRMPTGAGTGAGPFHSQSNEAWFIKTPGLLVVYPAFPDDVYGLLNASIDNPNPVIFFEHKYLYRKISGKIPTNNFTIPIGKAKLRAEGIQFSVITYGLGVHWALKFKQDNPNLTFDIVDLRTLLPWDKEMVFESVKKTGRAIILHEDTEVAGFGAEISAVVTENCFKYLDAPVLRCASLDTAIPMNSDLEIQFLANSRLDQTVKKLLAF